MARHIWAASLTLCVALLLAGCGKGKSEFNAGKKAEVLEDYDSALVHYERALKEDPLNAEYRLKATRMRFEAGQAHVEKGQKLRADGDLRMALAEFQKAAAIDPASPVAAQELQATVDLIAEAAAPPPATGVAPPSKPAGKPLMTEPPQLMPLSRDPINLKITNEARIVFETIGKLAGLTVVFDPEFQGRRINTELTNVTLEQALDVAALQSKAFWKPVTSNIIFVTSDSVQKRKDFEEYVVKTFYLNNTIAAQDLTEVVNALRQILDLRKVQQINAQNAIVIRDTLDKIRVAEKILADIDKAKPEVVVQVSVLQARRDRARDLGITPGSSAVLGFTPRNPTGGTGTGTGTSGTSTTPNQIRLSDLQRLASADYSLTLPGAVATALITDSTTRIIQNPEIRVVDGQLAKLNIGDRVPIATGSFQSGLGGTTGGLGAINPLVNTQFQYQDVGVNVSITPRIHSGREISMKVAIEVSSVASRINIGGIEQPIISQRKIEHDIRLQEGEVNVLGGIIERSQSKIVEGWPGLSKIPFLRYFFSSESVNEVESEVLIVLRPRIVRLPEIRAENLRSLATGSEQNIQVRPADNGPLAPSPQAAAPSTARPADVPVKPDTPAKPAEGRPTRLSFAPAQVAVGVGQTATIGVVVEDAQDLFSIPLLLQYDPKIISVEEVRHGGFLSGGTQEIAIVQRIDAERGQAIISATRQPNTAGVNGTGTLVGIVVKGLAPGTSSVSIVQANPRDSQQRPIQMVSSEAVVRVQ